LFVGLVLGALSPSAVITYLIAFCSGMMFGRLLYERKGKSKATYILIVIGFVMGYVVGSGIFRGDPRITAFLFVIGAILIYFLFNRKLIKDTFI
jgi:hypothetical protein